MSAKFTLNGQTHEVTILARRPNLIVSVDGRSHVVRNPASLADGTLDIDGTRIQLALAWSETQPMVRMDGRTLRLTRIDPRAEAAGSSPGQDIIRAPMPGAVITVHLSPGDAVQEGDVIVTIESMKLQTALIAPRDGHVAEVTVAEGETFEKDAVIVRLVPLGQETAA
ncbi:MAG: biotin/lipoyl-containing protein [Gemmobacter sp.]|nr:biotin/lipoyl-containing protein [Gemmobacter sp.]